MKPPTTSQPLGYRPTIEVSKKKNNSFDQCSVLNIQHQQEDLRNPSCFADQKGKQLLPARRGARFCVTPRRFGTGGCRRNRPPTARASAKENPRNPPKNHGKLAEIYRNSTKIQIQLFYLFGYPNPSGHWMALFTKWIRVG
jgi:hypothetical protein